MKEVWYYVRSEVKKLAHVESGDLQKKADTLLQDLGEQQRSQKPYAHTHTHIYIIYKHTHTHRHTPVNLTDKTRC